MLFAPGSSSEQSRHDWGGEKQQDEHHRHENCNFDCDISCHSPSRVWRCSGVVE
jgi:hypothetical protein